MSKNTKDAKAPDAATTKDTKVPVKGKAPPKIQSKENPMRDI